MLSVIIPTYKRTDSLLRLIRLLQKQTIAGAIEIILIDQNENGFLEREIGISIISGVKRIKQEQPNASAARNAGSRYALGDVLLFLDDDLVPEADFCEAGLNFIKKFSFIECFTPWVRTDSNPSDGHIALSKVIDKIDNELFVITDTISAALFIRKNSFLKSGGFDPFLFEFAKTAEDQEFFLRLPFKDIKLYYTTQVSVFHDEFQTGGCELRIFDYWVTREKCIKAWIFRYKIHNGRELTLTMLNYFFLMRSVFLNRIGLTSGVQFIFRQIKLFSKSLAETNHYLAGKVDYYRNPLLINHLEDRNGFIYQEET